MASSEIPKDLIPLGWTEDEWLKFLQEAVEHERKITQIEDFVKGTGKVLRGIGGATAILSFMLQQVTFSYFIYEEACQLAEGIVKQLVRCKQNEEAKKVLEWYQNELFTEYVNYHLQSKTLAPISWEAFKRHIENVRKFIEHYQFKLGMSP